MNAKAKEGNTVVGMQPEKKDPPKSKYPLDKNGNVDLSRMSL